MKSKVSFKAIRMMLEDENWSIEKATIFVARHSKPVDCIKDNLCFADFEVNEANIKKCLVNLAQIINEYGDVYLPIFERVHQEL